MSDNEKKEILKSELDEQQLDKAAGGENTANRAICGMAAQKEADVDHCENVWFRPKGDCSNTVETSIWGCNMADDCSISAVVYK